MFYDYADSGSWTEQTYRENQDDFRNVLYQLKAQENEIGDIWLVRDRGAQAICSEECADLLHQKISKLREVEITIETLSIDNLEIPFKRPEKIINTVGNKRTQASCSSFFANVPLFLV